jgi:cysteinyl-tRNA synthetase
MIFRVVRLSLSLLALLLAVGCHSRAQNEHPATGDLQWVYSWVYQLQNVEPPVVANSGFDLAVIDYSFDGTAAGEWTLYDVGLLQNNGQIVLSYLSIGEAEDYRFYWQSDWLAHPPSWLGPVNPDWPGNYKVRYWMSGWQDILYDYLDRILGEGFDGVYLDLIDAYYYWSVENPENPHAAQDMMDLAAALAEYVRQTHPGFYVFPQNAVELTDDADYLAVLDGVGKEDTWYDGDQPADADQRAFDLPFMDHVAAAGKLVLCVDYCREPAHVADFYAKARARGFVPYSTVRDLDQLTINVGLDP